MVTDPDINKRLAAVEKRLTAVERAVDKPVAAAAAKLGSMSRVNPTEKQIAASRLNGAKPKSRKPNTKHAVGVGSGDLLGLRTSTLEKPKP